MTATPRAPLPKPSGGDNVAGQLAYGELVTTLRSLLDLFADAAPDEELSSSSHERCPR